MINLPNDAKLLAVTYEARHGMRRTVPEETEKVGDSYVQTDDRPGVPCSLALR